VVLVTHDRYMLDRVSTIVLGLDGTAMSALFADIRSGSIRSELAVRREQKGSSGGSDKQQRPTLQEEALSYKNSASGIRWKRWIHAAEERLREDSMRLTGPRRNQ
jgi:ATP-binding cassette subfamily F protein uup